MVNGDRSSAWRRLRLVTGLVSAAVFLPVIGTSCGVSNPPAASAAPANAEATAANPTTITLAPGAATQPILENLPATMNVAEQRARVEQLKNDAFKAISVGQFERASELLVAAAHLDPADATVAQMNGWIGHYRDRMAINDADRREDYDKAVGNVKKLGDAGLEMFAYDSLASAAIHADDKDAFRAEPWVKECLSRMAALATEAELKGDWLSARRIYTDLSAIEPVNPTWRTKMNEVARRVNMLLTYAPDKIEQAYKAEADTRQRALEIVDPEKAAIAATRPAVDEAMNEAFRIDWQQMLAGVRSHMLVEALDDIREHYYRQTSYPELVTGGVVGLEQLISTTGIESTFASLSDAAKVREFGDALKQIKDDANAVDAPKDARLLRAALNRVIAANRQSIGLPDEVLVYEFCNGATAVLDPFTNVIWPYDLPEFQKSTQGDFTGVGIQIRNDNDGWLKVVSPLPDSPAYRAGIQADDLVTQIDGKNAKGVTTIQAVKAITGPAGTSVRLTVRSPDGKEIEHTLLRQIIRVASVKGWTQRANGAWEWLVDRDNGIGYVRLTNFTRESSKEVADAVDQIRGENGKAIILDLRQNPGGLLSAACEIADKFLTGGNIVSTRSAQNKETAPPVDADRDSDDVDLPVIVLVNQYSASASEIVSGALKDHQRALIVGERTFGKGSVQMLFPLERREAYLKMTTSHYYLPSGRCLHREENSTEWGVEPDVTVEMTPEQMSSILNMRQQLDVVRDKPAANPTTLPEEFKTPEEQLLASDPQLGAAVLMLRMRLAGAPVM